MPIIRNTALILLALFIDGLQAAISLGISVVAAYPGTIGGATTGCIAGEQIAGSFGCWAGGIVVGTFGTLLNPLLATVTIPVGIALSFAITTCISIVVGWGFLVPLLFFSGIKPQRKLPWGLGEMIPGINNIPFWTFLTISSLWADATKKGFGAKKAVLTVVGRRLADTRGIMELKDTKNVVIENAKARGVREGLPIEGVPETELIPLPNTRTGIIRASEKQFPTQGIRPRTPPSPQPHQATQNVPRTI
jgi:hypothetical protein